MREKFLYPHVMFDVDAGGYCGVFVPTDVMKKIEKATTLFQKQIQSILYENKEKLLVSNWTLANTYGDDGKIDHQQIVNYSDPSDFEAVEDRIRLFIPKQSRKVDVYICDRETAEDIAMEILQEASLEAQKGGEGNG